MENNLKRFLSLLLALVMVIGLMPVGHVHAEEGNTINLVVGDTHEITLDGDYSSLNGTGNEVVSVDAEFTPKLTAYTVSNTTTDATLESGKYVLQNTRVSKFLESTSEGGKLWLAAKLITTAETWTITKVDDGYTMKASNGQYLTFDGSSSSLTDTETVLSFTWKDTSTWQIGCGGQYLNSYDSEQKVAGWWEDGDVGSQWRLYKVTDQPAYSWTLGDAVSQIEDGGYYIFENNEASSRAASLVSSKWNNTNNGGGGSGYGLLMEHNKTNFGEQDIWKITGTAGEYHVQDCHGWNLLVASGKATLTPESQTTVIGQDSTSYEGKWQISVGGVHLNWWGGSNGDGVQVAGWGDVNDRNSQWNIYEVIPTALGSTTIALTALKAGTAEITIGDTTYHIHVTDGTGEHEHSYTGEVTTPATCTEDGVMTYTCVCGERYTEVIPATGHAPVTTGYKKPTLCEPGATGTTSCGVCGEVFSESTAINQLPVASVLHDNKIVALNGCEYTYNASNSSFTHTDANGTVYSVKPSAGVGVQQPALIPQTTAEVFSVSLIWGSGDFAGRVQISGNGSIHFHTNADKPYWNKCGSGSDENSDWTNHGLYLFVAGGDSAEFPGYTQVTSAEGMVDGGNYLIAARTDDDHGGKWYVMRPTAGTNEFMHVAQYTGMKEITGHTPGEKVRVNEVAATCGAAGSYDEVIYCTVCGAEMERTTVTVDATGEHIYDNAYDTDCNVCGADREVPFSSEKIPGESILGKGSSVDTSEPAYDKSVGNAFDGDYNTFWATDPGHGLSEAYLIADLGGKYLINQVAYTKRFYNGSYDCTGNLLDYIIEVSTDGETWKQVADGETEGGTTVITFDAVEAAYVRLTATRSYHWEEENRNKVMTAAELEIFKLVCTEHTPAAEAVKENEKAATCTETGSYDSVVYCSVCCAELSRETIAVDALGHNYEAVVTAPTCTEGGYTTYTCDLCGDSYVADETSALGHSYEKGFCTVCGGYEAPELNADGFYEIGNAGQLYWFAQKVNSGGNEINAILTDNIVVNENLMEKITIAEDGTATVNEGETIREWAPIGGFAYYYSGTFDGNGKTVAGLYRNVSAIFVGLIGYLEGSGKVQNVTVADSYFRGGNNVGGVVGYSSADSTVSNCYNTGSVSGTYNVGGVVGFCYDGGTVSNCYNTGSVSGSYYVGGVVGFCYDGGTVSNCYNTGTVSGSSNYVGGVVGYSSADSTVSNCYNTGSVSGTYNVGGVVGFCYDGGTVSNCYNTGSVSGMVYNGGVVGDNSGTVTNCFYLDTCGAEGEGTAKSEAQFASGEVAWLLNGSTDEGELVWKQNIGTDAIPGFEGEIVSYSSKTGAYYNKGNHEHQYEAVVTDPTCEAGGYTTYTCTVCGDIYVADEVSALGHSYEDGFCTVCGGYEAPELNADGFYEIGNAGQLYWFAAQVNNGAQNINAILTADIVDNENLMEKITIAEDGTATVNEGETIREWAPIGGLDYYYSGTFDGNGKTVTGLYRNVSAKYVGLIGYLEGSGKVQNVTVADSYFCGGNYVGGVVGYNLGTVSYCYSSSYAKGDSFIGGVVGYSSSGSTVSNCHNTGTVSGSSYVGGVVGFCYDGGTVSNCYNTGSVSGSYYVGGVVGYCYTGSTVSNCYNTGSVSCSKSSYVGGVVGFSSGTVTNCFYLDTCGAEGDGTAKTEAQFASGEVAWLLNGSTDEGKLVWKQNIGTDAIPGFEGEIVSYSSETGAYYNKGNQEHQYEAVVTDPTCTEPGYTTYTCSVCGDSYVADETPALGHSYEAVVTDPTCTEPGYTTYTCDLCGDSYVADETSALGHSYENGFCTACGGYEAPKLNADGFYEIGNAGQLYWFAQKFNSGGNEINAILTDKIVVNENLMEKITIAEDGTATVNEGETIREWAPIGGSIYPYSGTFDGNGKTVTGLYRNVSANYVGLIGYLEGSGKVQNVTVADSYFCGGNCVGGVVGYSCAGSTVSNCHNTGSVSGGDDVGGVVGNNGGSMTECCNAGTVSGSNYVGGVAGWNADSTLSNCYNTGTVSGNDYVGGVAGFCFTATLSNCYNTGTVSGGDYVGGVVGLNDDGGTVSNCYNTGTVSGGGYVGGVVGYCYIGGTVSNCYNTGSINAGMFNGGVVGVNNGTMSNCFYLDTCGAEGEGTAKTEAQFASGEVAWLLNGSTDEGELVWKQNIGTDAIPGFEGEIVSYSSKTGAYYNKGNHEHQYEAVVTAPTCTEPGYTTYTCTVCGDTYTGDETTALGHTASEAVRENEVAPTLNSEGSYESVVYCSVCSAELSRTTITVPALQGAVAQVNGVKYATLTEAIEKAYGNMAVHMLSDVTEDIVIDKALILLMNSHTLYGQVKITGPNVQIQGCINTSTDPKGKIVAEGKDAIVIGVKDQKNENISVYANFVDVTSTTDCALLIYDGKATFNNSDLTSTSTSYAAVQGSGRDFGDVSMSLCNVTSEHEVAIYWPHVGTLTVNNDCTITGATGLYIKQGKANLYSCTVKGTGAQVTHKVNNNGGDSTGDAITIDKGATEPVVNTSANLISENGNLVGMYGGTVELFGANLTAKKNAIRMEDGVLTLRGMTINAGYCALFIRGGEVNMSGTTMNSTGDYAAIQGNGTCGGDVTIRSGTVSSANNIAIYWPGSGNLTVMDATVTGATAIYAKQGNVTISGGTFRATGEKADFSHSGNGAYATGDAVVLESCDYGTLTASITYGRFISDHGKAVAAYAQPGHTELSGFITGGHYNTEVDADYLAEGYCAALTGEYYSVAQHYYFSEVTDPDCENGGYTTYTCGRCGDSYVTDEIPALGHTEEVIPGKDATCTETGLTEGKKCTVCGETTVAQEEIPALGHKPGEAVVENEKAATCTETGSYDTVVYCSVCSEELSRETTTVDALGHKEEAIPGKDATCTETGLTEGKKCTVCGETTVAQQEIPALGHNYEAVVTAPTCTEGGYTTYTCSRCDDTYTGDETTALGHTASEAVKENEKAATCTETGSYDSVVCCSVCSAEMSRETVTVDALGHKEEAIPGKDATCTETGLTEGKKCTVCGETTVAQQEIPALGHDWLEDGSCSRCEEKKEEEMENPFVDVPADEYYLEPVLWAVGKGITSGTSENTFSPYRIITRGQAVTFLWRAMGSPEPAMTINPFVDVTETDYYYKAVLWAAEKGITAGVGDNRFAPGQECTRAQILTFLWVAMDKPASDVEVNFNDVHEGDYYYNAVAWAYENGITAGMGGGAFGVGILCTRAHVITFLYRAAA